ncbi:MULTISPECIES: hypothetical protein [Hymenobacter]|uniref:Uncharacterized protein n=1 Tax=Hymenobacter jejuensis TaxID=2502781 RepID=A0A5B8A323_9BACT|nr:MULTISPECIES: hypothetical protein [Hymenobacter]MBC6989628.1 hypothetical protein [Hymenobacter sp. BT491]QDA61690.1 hypothetical protein FHG12_17010 [Hymenobacter jejuensis]
MADVNLNKLQEIITNAENNAQTISLIRKNIEKVNSLMAEVNAMLEPGFKPEQKERKPRAQGSTGTGRRGRPKKSESAQ